MTNQFFDNYQDDVLPDEQVTFGNFVDLPFPYLRLSWWNGNAQLANNTSTPTESIAAFGGWYSPIEYFTPAVTSVGSYPPMFTETQLHPRNGNPFDVMQARLLYVSYVTHRKEWFVRDNGKKNSRLEVLCMLGQWNNEVKHFDIWGPVVLAGSGYTAKYIEDAFTNWQKTTAAARQEYANSMGASNFLFPIGSFDEIHIERVGSGNQTSPITPPRMKEPRKQDFALFKSLFIGHNREVFQIVKIYKDEAKPWIDDFAVQAERSEQKERERDAVGAARYGNQPQSATEAPGQPQIDNNDEIPF